MLVYAESLDDAFTVARVLGFGTQELLGFDCGDEDSGAILSAWE